MEPEKSLKILKEALKPTLDELKAEVIELTLKNRSGGLTLRLLADKKGSITVDECALINKRMSSIIEDKGLIEEGYSIEVSSPGLDRPLKEKRDFEKFIDEKVDIWLLNPLEGKSFIDGKIEDAEEDKVSINMKDGKNIGIPYHIITKAKLKL